jgi:hypothetical protein
MTASDATMLRKRSRLRPTAFRLGVLTGVVLFLVAWWLVYSWTRPTGPVADFDVEVVADGAALTRHGAGQFEVRNPRAILLRQVCNGACDDLSYRVEARGDDSYGVAVLDPKGRCLSCDHTLYVETHANDVARFLVGGDKALSVDADYYKLRANGALERARAVPAETSTDTPKS